MADTKQMLLRISPDLWEGVEAARGDVPRSVWVRRAIELALGWQGGAPVVAGSAFVPAQTDPRFAPDLSSSEPVWDGGEEEPF